MGPLPQGSEQEILRKARAKAKASQAPPPELPPIELPKAEKPWSVSGYAENTLDAGWELAKGLYEIIPSTVKSYQKNIPYLLKNSKHLTAGMVGEAAKEAGGQLWDAIADKYKKHGLMGAIYYDTPGVVSDVLTVVSLGGSSIKNAGKVAKAAGAGQKAQRLIEAGKWLEELPGQMARKGIDASVKGVSGGKVDLAKRREFLALKGEEQGRKIVKAERYANDLLKKLDTMTPEEKALFHKSRVFGEVPGYGVPYESLPPKIKEALASFDDLVNKVDPNMTDHGITEFYKSRGMLNEETAKTTLAKKFALEAFDDVSDASVAKARQLIEEAEAAGHRPPIYGQNVFVDEVGKTHSMDTLLDDMITGGKHVREGKIAPLEKMKGAKGYTKDPSVYAREMIKNYINTEAKVRLSERLLETPKLIKGSAQGIDPAEFSKSIPEGVHRKYYEDRIRAEALKTITDPTIKRLLKWEYIKNNSALIRIYDRLHGIFARSATMYNPKWVTGNVVGDAVLGLLAGSDWMAGRKYLKAGAMPAQVAGRNVTLSTQDILKNPGPVGKAIAYLPEKAADVAGYVDQATRAGIISKEAGRRLKEVASGFEGSAASLEEVLRSTDRFSDVQVQMRLLAERVERESAEASSRTRELIRLGRAERKLDLAIQEKQGSVRSLAEREGKVSEQMASVEARANVAAQEISRAKGRLNWLTSPERAEMVRAAKGAQAAKAFGRKAAEAKAKLSKLEAYYNALSTESPDVVRAALGKVGKFDPSGLLPEMDEALSKIPGYSRTRSAEISKDIRGQVRDRVLRKRTAEYQERLEVAKREALAALKDKAEDGILNLTESFEETVGRGKAALSRGAEKPSKVPAREAAGLTKAEREAARAESLRKATLSKQASSFGKTDVVASKLRRMEEARDTLRQKIVNLSSERDAIVRDLMDDLVKRGDLERLVPGLQAQVDIVRPAVERANAFIGDYLALDGFEQAVMRRVIPFYPWAKAMSMLAFRLPFLAPVKTFLWNRFSDALATLTQDPELPKDFRGKVPVAVTEDGKTVWAKLTAYSPFEGNRTSHVAGIPVPGMFNIAERNPWIALGYSFVGGKTTWDASSLPYGEQMVSTGDGTVLRVKPNGEIVTEIPQTPLVSGIMHTFPTVQLIQQVLQPYWTNKYNWAGIPQPILNPDGSYKYPREMWDRIGAAVGVNLQTRSREDIIRSRKAKAIKNIHEMRSVYRRADPEEREFILQAMKDYIQQEVHGGQK